MRILFIAPRLPIPADTGGKIRTWNLMKQAAKRHQVDLVCFSFDADDASRAKELLKLGVTATLVPAREPDFVHKIGSVLFASAPYSAAKYYSRGMEAAIQKLARENPYDVVHFDHIHMTHYDKFVNGQPRLVDEHNVEYKILERCAGVEKSFIKKNLFRSQSRKMERFEAKKIGSSSACSAVSDEDAKVLMRLARNEKPVYILPNGVDTEFFEGSGGKGQGAWEKDAAVFTGSMDWLPNEDAAVFFCREVLPLIWKQNAGVKFYIVGKNPSQTIRELARKDSRIVVTGRVDDVRTYIQRAKIFVVPIRIGGGTRLKILEAMSMQKAVVSTTVGAEGIACTGDVDIVLGDTPQEFARQVIILLKDQQKRETLGAAARRLILEKYDWRIIGETLNKIYEDITNAGRQ